MPGLGIELPSLPEDWLMLVAEALNLQKAPELRFVYDVGMEHASRVEELLREIESERKPTE